MSKLLCKIKNFYFLKSSYFTDDFYIILSISTNIKVIYI